MAEPQVANEVAAEVAHEAANELANEVAAMVIDQVVNEVAGTPAKALFELGDGLIAILKRCDARTIMRLRRVCRPLRDFIDEIKPDLQAEQLHLEMSHESLIFEYQHDPNEPAEYCVGDLIDRGPTVYVRQYMVPETLEERMANYFIGYLRLLELQRTPFKHFSVSWHSKNSITDYERSLNHVKTALSTAQPIRTDRLTINANNEEEILSVLPFIDPIRLDNLSIEFPCDRPRNRYDSEDDSSSDGSESSDSSLEIEGDSSSDDSDTSSSYSFSGDEEPQPNFSAKDELSLARIGELAQFKQARELKMDFIVSIDELPKFFHFEKCEVSVKLNPARLEELKNTFTAHPTFKKIKTFIEGNGPFFMDQHRPTREDDDCIYYYSIPGNPTELISMEEKKRKAIYIFSRVSRNELGGRVRVN